MKKENIITITQTHQNTNFNWAIKRYLPNFKDGESTIIGIRFPWKRIFDNDKNLDKISQVVTDTFNDFTESDFFKNINYTAQYRDIFLLKVKNFSSYYWIEFIFTKGKWNLKTKGYSWEKESYIFSQGNNKDDDFIVSKIDYKLSSESFDIENWLENFNNRKFKLPIYTNEESFEKSNYIFHFGISDGLRRDRRMRSVNLLIDQDFDYFLHINSNEYSEISGKEIDYIQQGQTPKNIIFELLKIISENKSYQTYGRSMTDIPRRYFMFKIDKEVCCAKILVILDDKNSDLRRLEELEENIEKWVDKIIEFQKQN